MQIQRYFFIIGALFFFSVGDLGAPPPRNLAWIIGQDEWQEYQGSSQPIEMDNRKISFLNCVDEEEDKKGWENLYRDLLLEKSSCNTEDVKNEVDELFSEKNLSFRRSFFRLATKLSPKDTEKTQKIFSEFEKLIFPDLKRIILKHSAQKFGFSEEGLVLTPEFVNNTNLNFFIITDKDGSPYLVMRRTYPRCKSDGQGFVLTYCAKGTTREKARRPIFPNKETQELRDAAVKFLNQ